MLILFDYEIGEFLREGIVLDIEVTKIELVFAWTLVEFVGEFHFANTRDVVKCQVQFIVVAVSRYRSTSPKTIS
jgi:hypothetical protein